MQREVKEMIRTISLRKLVKEQKLKIKKNERVYDKEWHMFFPCEEARQEFRDAIARAEEDIVEGREGTWEELLIEFEEEYGIQLQH